MFIVFVLFVFELSSSFRANDEHHIGNEEYKAVLFALDCFCNAAVCVSMYSVVLFWSITLLFQKVIIYLV